MQTEVLHDTRLDGCPDLAPAADPLPFGAADQPHSTLELVELILKDPDRVDALNRAEQRQAELLPRYLAIALASCTLFSVAMILLLNAARPESYPQNLVPAPPARLADGSALGLWFAYTFGPVIATGICLPSFYFFALLVGVRMSVAQIAVLILRGTASSAILLVGLVPIYVAVVLAMIVFKVLPETLETGLYLGLALPFLAGLEGMRSIYRAMMAMGETLPPERFCRRACFLRRLTLSWTACYTAVSPVLIYRLWEFFA